MWSTVRQFGLGYCDLSTTIYNVAVMLRVLALKLERDAASIPKLFYVLNLACAVCYMFNYQVSVLCYVFVRCRQTGDVLAAILVMSVSTNSLIGITKLIYMYMYRTNVQALVSDYLAYDAQPAAPRTAAGLSATMRQVKKRAMLFWVVMMGNGFVYNLLVFMPSMHVLYDEHVLFGLKYIMGTSNYFLARLFIIISVVYICFAVSNITGLLIVTTGYSEGRMLTLSQEIREIWSDALHHYEANYNLNHTENAQDKSVKLNRYVKERLHRIVQSHATNIGLVKKVEGIFRNAIAAELLILTAALVADLLGGLEQTYIVLPFSVMQVSMDCYVGQKLMDASLIFETAVYDCKWENFDKSNMKTVLLILKMAQKTPILSAGGVSTLSFGCLMALVKSVYSAYAALHSTME